MIKKEFQRVDPSQVQKKVKAMTKYMNHFKMTELLKSIIEET
jgi:hypothetical protein